MCNWGNILWWRYCSKVNQVHHKSREQQVILSCWYLMKAPALLTPSLVKTEASRTDNVSANFIYHPFYRIDIQLHTRDKKCIWYKSKSANCYTMNRLLLGHTPLLIERSIMTVVWTGLQIFLHLISNFTITFYNVKYYLSRC
jgi:hypothetical protein